MMPEGEYNVLSAGFVAKVRKHMAQGQANGADFVPQERRAAPPQEFARRARILVNDESTDVPAGGCLAITDTYTSGYGPIFLKCVQPSTTFRRRYTFAPLTGLPANGQAPAQEGPDYYALYNSGSPSADKGYGPTPGQYYLSEGYPQISVCHGVWDSTAKIMLATLSPINELWGKWSGDVAKSAPGTVLISTGNGAWTDSGMTIANVVNVPDDAAMGDLVNVSWFNGVPEGYPREC